MSLRVILAIAKNNFRKIGHDRRTVGMIVLMPIIFILLFGFTFAGEPENIRTIVVNEDIGVDGNTSTGLVNVQFSQSVIDNFDRDVLSLAYKDDFDKALDEVETGRAWALICFPANFSQGVVNWVASLQNVSSLIIQSGPFTATFYVVPVEGSDIVLYVDASNSQVAASVLSEVTTSISETAQEHNPDLALTSLLSTDFIYGENIRFIDFFAPGIIGLIVTMITVILTIVSFVRERTAGTLDRLFVSPAKPSDIVFGYTLTFTFVAIFQSVELLLIAHLLFDITFVGSIALALGLVVLYAVGVLGLGILLSTLAKNEFQAIQFVPLILLPSIMLAGVLWPIEAMPEVIRPISSVIPLTYVANALRSVMIRGWGPAEIWVDILALIIFAVLMIGIAILLVNKKANRLGLRKKKES